jgi:hypothetical protein
MNKPKLYTEEQVYYSMVRALNDPGKCFRSFAVFVCALAPQIFIGISCCHRGATRS